MLPGTEKWWFFKSDEKWWKCWRENKNIFDIYYPYYPNNLKMSLPYKCWPFLSPLIMSNYEFYENIRVTRATENFLKFVI